MKLSRGIVASILAALIMTGVAGMTQTTEPVEIWLVVDGTAIGTVKPDTFTYSWDEGYVIDVETNELVQGCSQARIFSDRYEARP